MCKHFHSKLLENVRKIPVGDNIWQCEYLQKILKWLQTWTLIRIKLHMMLEFCDWNSDIFVLLKQPWGTGKSYGLRTTWIPRNVHTMIEGEKIQTVKCKDYKMQIILPLTTSMWNWNVITSYFCYDWSLLISVLFWVLNRNLMAWTYILWAFAR